MSYLLDKKQRQKKFTRIIFFILVILVLLYFRSGISGGLSRVSFFIFRPVMLLGGNVSEKISGTAVFFQSKKSLLVENENLNRELDTMSARLTNYNSILDDNLKIMDILGRKKEGDELIISAILSKPNRSPYNTLLIDAGTEEAVVAGDLVFARSSIPIGRVAEVYAKSSKVILFSNSGEKTSVIISGKDIFVEAVGRGGGNFEMILPRDLELPKGTEIILPGLDSRVLGIVETTISDPRDAFKKVLLVSPVNIQELKFVQIKRK